MVWSRIDPSLRPHKGDPELFSDSVTALPNTHFAQQLRALEDQPLPEPFRHDIPFLILYQLSETAGQEDILARLVESDDSILSDGGSHHPRLYEQIECIEAEGCEGGMFCAPEYTFIKLINHQSMPILARWSI